jgi:hypothetical protein
VADPAAALLVDSDGTAGCCCRALTAVAELRSDTAAAAFAGPASCCSSSSLCTVVATLRVVALPRTEAVARRSRITPRFDNDPRAMLASIPPTSQG